MSKSIYKEVLDILVDSFQDPQDEENDCYMLDRKQMNKVSRAIRQAQKQEKLLGLYREKDKYTMVLYTLPDVELSKHRRIVEQIKELENDNYNK